MQMTFPQSFRFASYLLLSAGFLSLFAGEALGPVLTGLYFLALAGSWRIRPIAISSWVQLALFICFLGIFVVDALLFSDFISATVHLLVLVSLVKAYSLEADRDYLVLYFISFGFLLFASAYTISISFLVVLIFYMFSAILTFILFESKKAYEENRSAQFSLKAFANVAVVVTALIVLLSIPIFLVVPRVSIGLFSMDRQLDLNMSGFSDKVNLGDIGQIITNSKVVMRVRVDASEEGLPHDLKWRGIALDHYDGLSWTNTRDGLRRLRREDDYDGVILSERRRPEENLIQQSIVLEPFSNSIFGAPQMVLLTGDVLPRSFLFEDGNDSVGVFRRVDGPLKYVVYSDVVARRDRLAVPVEGVVPEVVQRKYLQMPEMHPAVLELAEEITREYDSSLEKALAVERYLQSNFKYSLENTPAEAADPLLDFLMVTRAGHCEYFATAQAVLMRSLGIPTRLVNGFRMGEFNGFSDYFIVRQSDAHSWVEGYFPGPGWVEFDSTPAVGLNRSGFSLTRWFSQMLDSVDMFWTELITFDRVKQVGLFRSFRYGVRETWSQLARASVKVDELAKLGWMDGFARWDLLNVAYMVVGGLCMVLLGLLHRYRPYLRLLWKQWLSRGGSPALAPEYYIEMLRVLKRKGLSKKPSETPYEFLERIRPEFDSPTPALITELYYRNRFGSTPLKTSDLSEIYGWLQALRREWLRKGAVS